MGDFLERAGSLELADQVLARYLELTLAPAPEDYARLARIRRALGRDASPVEERLRRQRAAMEQAPARLRSVRDNLLASGKAGHAELIPL